MASRKGDVLWGQRRKTGTEDEFVFFSELPVGKEFYLGAHKLKKTGKDSAGKIRFDPNTVVQKAT